MLFCLAAGVSVDAQPLEEYSGPRYHVFYHFLIAFPEIAEANSYGADLFTDCVTPSQFRRSLEELYRNDFVLIDIKRYASSEPVMVPAGKKPLVMSFDDLNYYSKNHGRGISDRLVVDEKGRFAMYTLAADSLEMVTYDNGVVPMLEAFCEEFPDFSPFGDKGLIALTGYDGILGYRTQSDSPDREAETVAACYLVEALKQAGWQFASHSYGHIHLNKSSAARVAADAEKWRDEVGSIVGSTRVYVFPYGEYDDQFDILTACGFDIFCGVGMRPYFTRGEDYIFMDRQFVDGTSLANFRKHLAPLMDAEYVYDGTRYETTIGN